MTAWNTNKNAFASSIQTIKADFHAFSVAGVPKGSKAQTQQKRALISSVTHAVDQIDTADFGIRVIVLKTKD